MGASKKVEMESSIKLEFDKKRGLNPYSTHWKFTP